MAYSISNVTADLASILHGTNTNKINNINGLFNRAARQLMLDIDPQETIRFMPITTPIFNQVYDYAVPVDLKGNKIIDILPQGSRNAAPGSDSREVYLQGYNQAFDTSKALTSSPEMTILFNSLVKTVRLASPQLPTPTLLNSASLITANGTWSAGGSASNLRQDFQNYVGYSSSLMFDLAASGSTGYLENSTMSSINLSQYILQLNTFLYTYLPTASAFSSVELRFGSSSSNYYSLSVSTTQENTSFSSGWNFLNYPWSSMTTVGTPDATKITYIRVTWNYNGTAQAGVRLNDIFSVLGLIFQMEYYSKYMFRNASGTWIETVTAADGSDLVNLDTESYNIYLNYVAYLACQQTQGLDAMFFDANYFLQLYQEGVKRYKSMYKSQVQLPQSTYYSLPNPRNNYWTWGRTRWS